MDRFGLFRLQYSMVKLFFTSTFARWRSDVPTGHYVGVSTSRQRSRIWRTRPDCEGDAPPTRRGEMAVGT
jgi:hypothetical protein